jgi:hypothetical protein
MSDGKLSRTTEMRSHRQKPPGRTRLAGRAGGLALVAALALAGCSGDSSPEAAIRSRGGKVTQDGKDVRVVLTGWKGKEEDYALVAKIPGVVELFMAHRQGAAPVTDRTLEVLRPLSRLRELDLDGTAVTDAGMPALAALSELTVLHLERTAVTGKGLETLGGLERLRHLYVKGSGVNDEDAGRWAKQHPQCELHR